MTIANFRAQQILLPEFGGAVSSNRERSAGNENEFASFLAKAEKPRSGDAVKPVKKPDIQKDRPAVDAEKISAKSEIHAAIFAETQEIDEFQDAEVIDNEEFVKKLALAVNVPADAISQILTSLNIQPEELTDPEVLDMFAQKLADISDSAELFDIPDEEKLFEAVNAVFQEFKAETAPVIVERYTTEPRIYFERFAAPAITIKAEQPEIDPEGSDEPEEESETIVRETLRETISLTEKKPETQPPKQEGINANQGNHRENLPEPTVAAHHSLIPETRTNSAATIAESVRNVNISEVIDQIVSRIKVEVKSDVSEIRILLKPEHLGEVSMKIEARNGIISAQFAAENQRVKEAIEAGLTNLKDSLNQQGINVSQLSVSVGNGDAEQAKERFMREASLNVIGLRSAGNGAPEEVYADEKKAYQSTVDYMV